MILEEAGDLKSYELIDSGDGYRLERFGDYVLSRPDPAVLWKKSLSQSEWNKADAEYLRSEEDRGEWNIHTNVPERWLMNYEFLNAGKKDAISFYAKLTPFKHTGVFPEQEANWKFICENLAAYSEHPTNSASREANEPIKILNLFGYTGIASVLCAKFENVKVTHVDASKPSIGWAQENMTTSNLSEDSIRWILEDALKFVKREVRRGAKYQAIIMDPPAFGRGAKGEVWKFNEQLPELLKECVQLIDPKDFKFVIINAYAVSVSSLLLNNMLQDFAAEAQIKNPSYDYGELVLKQRDGKLLSTGIFGRLKI
jgi:23S rRNA (cytosine1962-C5)-methyltransferase